MQIKNLKVTTARKELLELLANQNKPISFDDIKNEITMDKATFYRNISKFEDEEMVHSFESNDKKRYYEIQRTPHAHFICNNCNTINCLHKPISLKLDGCCITDMIFKGLCQQCNTKQSVK